jgi:hypothetical protein
MKFDELCDYVLVEADKDYISGKGKVFSLADDAIEKAQSLVLDDVKDLIRKTTLPITPKYMVELTNDLQDYLPSELSDLKTMIKRSLWSAFDDTEKKSERAAAVVFAFLKSKKYITPGIPRNEEPEDIESLANELEDAGLEDPDYKGGLSISDVEKYGGSVEGSRSHSEDESKWY